MSYASMRVKPQTRGRCHSANYWDLTQILLSDVDAANSIAVIGPVAIGTMKHAPLDLAAYIQTVRAGPARVLFVLQGDLHPQTLCLVGELEADRAVGPLVEFLVVGVANIIVLPDITHIPDHDRLHAVLMKPGDQSGSALVLDILDLLFNLLQLPLLGGDHLLATAGAFLHPAINATI
jgi:hypothetical protein